MHARGRAESIGSARRAARPRACTTAVSLDNVAIRHFSFNFDIAFTSPQHHVHRVDDKKLAAVPGSRKYSRTLTNFSIRRLANLFTYIFVFFMISVRIFKSFVCL